MRFSNMFIPTLRDDPKDAETISHKMMLRGGLIRQLVAGVYSFLPLGWKSLLRIMNIIREEMNAIEGQEILMPALTPMEMWAETGRDKDMADIMLDLKDRKEHHFALAPTHEEVITHLARGEIRSYKELPQIWYQMQTKFRDEARPKGGLLRVREFIMKDAYSLGTSQDDLDRAYDAHEKAYRRIFDRCGIEYYLVGASSGAMGGSGSQEFMVVSDAGEDQIVVEPKSGYAANIEVARAIPKPFEPVPLTEKKKVHTPDLRTVEEVSAFLKLPPAQMLKTLVYMTSDDEPYMFMLRGDHQLSEEKINGIAGKIMRPAQPEEVKELTGADVGFIGPVGPLDNPSRLAMVPKFVDEAVPEDIRFATGACENDYHITGYELSDIGKYKRADIREVEEGDLCELNNEPVQIKIAIELGHIFKLGTKYSASMNAVFQDEQGNKKPIIMGSYGIGVGRILSSVIELHADKKGMVFPITVAPYDVIITVIGADIPEVAGEAEKIYNGLKEAGVETILDDRDMRPGVKFSDADLIGIPIRVNVGGRGLKDGIVEIFDRAKKEYTKVPLESALPEILAYRKKLYAELEPKG